MNSIAPNKNRNGRLSWYGFDLDGTLAYYDSGSPHQATVIGEPIPRMITFLKFLLDRGAHIKIFTARVSIEDQLERADVVVAIKSWCIQHIGQSFEVTCVKDYACLGIFDDRAHHVITNTGSIVSSQFSN